MIDIKNTFPDIDEIMPGEWSDHEVSIEYAEGKDVSVRLYREDFGDGCRYSRLFTLFLLDDGKAVLRKKVEYSSMFDWFMPEEYFRKYTEVTKEIEDEIIGYVVVSLEGQYYIADIHFENYGEGQKGFNIEVYRMDEFCKRKGWLGSVKAIRSSKNAALFKRRAEKLLMKYIEDIRKEDKEDTDA